jgi:hypothetical protein
LSVIYNNNVCVRKQTDHRGSRDIIAVYRADFYNTHISHILQKETDRQRGYRGTFDTFRHDTLLCRKP